MKKKLFIFCTFFIFSFPINLTQGSFFQCHAQTDTVAASVSDTLIVKAIEENESDSSNVQSLKFKGAKPVIAKNNLSSKKDSVQIKKHNPKTASWLAIIPGAGQIYNKKYWKLPIVYAGLGTTAFLIYYYEGLTSMYRKEHVARVNENMDKLNPKLVNYSDANILELRNFHRRNMEICVAACTILYVLSILDACVDAHLFYYDVSDNLTLGVKPKINHNPVNGVTSPGLGLIVKF